MVQKDFPDGTKTFYQAVNIKILQIIWENKKRKIKNNDGTNIFKYTFSLDTFKTLKKYLKKKSVRHKATYLNQAPRRKNCHYA